VYQVVAAQKRQRRWMLALMAVMLAGTGGLVGRWVLARSRAVPLEVVAAKDASFDLLRRDDTQSRSRATEQLKELSRTHPDLLDIRADQVLALSLELDELKLRIEHLKSEANAHQSAILRLQEFQRPPEWRLRVDDHRHELEVLQAQSDPLVAHAETLDDELNAAFRTLSDRLPEQANAPLPALRAQAVYFGVKGSDQAVELAERYRRLGGTDGWDVVAYAEYALNAHVAPDTQREALAALERLKGRDSVLIREYLLAARLRRALKDSQGASQELEAAMALNPHHETAQELMAWERAGLAEKNAAGR
jgi:hypothetical protein